MCALHIHTVVSERHVKIQAFCKRTQLTFSCCFLPYRARSTLSREMIEPSFSSALKEKVSVAEDDFISFSRLATSIVAAIKGSRQRAVDARYAWSNVEEMLFLEV